MLACELVHGYFERATLIVDLVDADEPIAFLVHILPQTDHDVLGVRLLLDEMSQQGSVLVVQSRVDLVHEVKGETLDLFACEYKSQ